jgi:hypothetical protein
MVSRPLPCKLLLSTLRAWKACKKNHSLMPQLPKALEESMPAGR